MYLKTIHYFKKYLNKTTFHTLEMVYELTKKELKIRYKHLAFGYVWSVLNPLFFVLIYYFVFKVIMKVPTENYPLFLVAGLFPWQWISNSISVAPTLFWSNASLIKKTQFPRNLIPLVTVFQDTLHFLVTIPLIIVLLFIWDGAPKISWLYGIPLLTLLQFLFTYSLNLLIATLTIFFRDLERFTQILLNFSFYMTPVLYSESLVPEKFRGLLPLNPFATLIINWRNLIMTNTLNWELLGYSVLWSILFLGLSHWIYKRLVWKFAELI
jgi:lipopolysaccharide transport system permease protein